MSKHKPGEFPLGTICRIAVGQRVFVAEVRNDFGKPTWGITWNGFMSEKKQEVTQVLWRPDGGGTLQNEVEYPCDRETAHGPHLWSGGKDDGFRCPGILAHPNTMIGRPVKHDD